MEIVKAAHAELIGKLRDLQSSHERCPRNIKTLQGSLDKANKLREDIKSKLAYEGESH